MARFDEFLNWLNAVRVGSPAALDAEEQAAREASRQAHATHLARERIAAREREQEIDLGTLPEETRVTLGLPAGGGRIRANMFQTLVHGLGEARKQREEK